MESTPGLTYPSGGVMPIQEAAARHRGPPPGPLILDAPEGPCICGNPHGVTISWHSLQNYGHVAVMTPLCCLDKYPWKAALGPHPRDTHCDTFFILMLSQRLPVACPSALQTFPNVSESSGEHGPTWMDTAAMGSGIISDRF